MTNKRNRSGFTLAELLLTVAILIILFGLGFVAVTAYVRDLRLNEMDWTAKEIFIAAQNQLSQAKENGTLAEYNALPNDKKDTLANGRCYVIYPGTSPDSNPAWTMLMPFGAIDETVRLGGSYIIEFDPKAATVTQTYYSDNYPFGDYDTALQAGISDRGERKRYDGNHIIGWYKGDASSLAYDEVNDTPVLEVENAAQLIAQVNGLTESDRKVTLCVKGLTSEATTTIVLTKDVLNNWKYILDDITTGNDHFVQKVVSKSSAAFIPGEDIELFVTVMTSKASTLSNVKESNHVVTNSLFASSEESSGAVTAHIANFRHLENLDSNISDIKYAPADGGINLTRAEQVEDLTWSEFKIGSSYYPIKPYTGTAGGMYNEMPNYYPVSNLPASFTYEGNNRYIDGVTIGVSDTLFTPNAGLFGTVSGALTVSDLELRNFNINLNQYFYEANAGALVGSSSGALTITNVIAYNTLPQKTTAALAAKAQLEIRAGNCAGGLVGNASSATITGSAAAVYVRGRTAAGGLIGNLGGGTVTNSYVGGHTTGGEFVFPPNTGAADGLPGRPNVWATSVDGHAGGFAGTAGTVSFTNCYTTASAYVQSSAQATGGTANLFIGTSEDIPAGSYAAGWTYKNGKIVYPDLWMNDFADNAQMLLQPSEYNYDPFWDNDYYPYRLVQTTDDVWFLKTHVGDWALPGELVDVIN